jgi:hypothetical protein
VADDIGVGELADQQLGRGEPDVLRPAPDQDVDVAHRAVAQGSSTRSGTSVAAMSSAVRPAPWPAQRDVAGADRRDTWVVERRVSFMRSGCPQYQLTNCPEPYEPASS